MKLEHSLLIINEEILEHPNWVDDLGETIKRYSDSGWILAIISNQATIGNDSQKLLEGVRDRYALLKTSDKIVKHPKNLRLKAYFCPNEGHSCIQVSNWHPQGCGVWTEIQQSDEEYGCPTGQWSSFNLPKPGMLEFAIDYTQLLIGHQLDKVLVCSKTSVQSSRTSGVNWETTCNLS